MKTSSAWNFGTIVGKIVMGLVLAAMLSGINVTPALGDDDHNDRGRHDNGRYEKNKGRGHDRGRHAKRRRDDRRYDRGGRVYIAPPVIFVPPPPPGVEIFFPPVFIHP